MSSPEQNYPVQGSNSEGNPSLLGTSEARPSRALKGVLCVKCEHLNSVEVEECSMCRSHLWVNCLECGAKNRRINVRCDECKRRLHKGRSNSSKARSRRAGFNWWLVGMVVGGIVFAIILLFVVSGLKLPRLW